MSASTTQSPSSPVSEQGADDQPNLVRQAVLDELAADPFDDNEPLACGIENPDVCESCT